MNGVGYGITPFMGASGILARSSGGGGGAFVNEYSMLLDGVDEYFTGASTFSELDGQNKATFSMWVKPTSFSVGRILFSITKNTTAGNCQVIMYVDTSARLRGFVSTTGTYIYSNASVLTLNTWHHILFCIDLSQSTVSNRGRIFVDGVDQTGSGFSQLNITALPTSNSELYIGEDKNGYQNPFLNNMDEFAMWVGSDQRANISDIYNGGVPFDLSTLATAPDHWWRMGDNDTWSGSQWTLSDNIGSYDLSSANMEEADRVTDVPSVTPFTNTYSMSFDGVDEYFNVGYIAELNNASAFTFSGWYKQTTLDQERFLMGYFVDVSNWFGLYTWSNGNMYIHFKDVGLNKYGAFDYSTLVTANTWFNIVIVFNGSGSTNADRLKCFIDGTQVTLSFVGTQPTTTISGTNNLTLCKMDSYSQTFLGNADELAVWNSDQSSNVSTIYNSGTPNDLTSLSPLSWWRMGDGDTWGGSSWTLTDNGSGGNDATSVNMEEADRLPISPNSYSLNSFSFDGVDEYLDLGAPLNLRILGSVSVSCWVKYTDSGGTRYINSFGDKYGLYTSGGKLIWHYRNPSNQFLSVASLTNFNDGEWHHVMGVNDETNLKIYIDGVLNNSNTNGSTGIVGTNNSRIGARWTNANYFEGSIDEFYIWDNDQSANISIIYGNGVPTDISSLNPLGHWRMGENATWNGSTWTLTDQGSGGNDATSVNMEEADKTGDQAYVI